MKSFLFTTLLLLSATRLWTAELRDFQWRGLMLGMDKETVFSLLTNQYDVRVDKSRYLGFMNDEYPFTLKAYIFPYIRRIYIEFYQNQAYVISLQYNPGYYDFFQLTQKLENSYGDPVRKTTRLVQWEDPDRQLVLNLEYPTTVKIYDQSLLLRMNHELSNNTTIYTNQTVREQQRQALLDEL